MAVLWCLQSCPEGPAKTLGKFPIFQAKNVDFVVEYLDNDDEFHQGTETAWRCGGPLQIPLKSGILGFAQEKMARVKKSTLTLGVKPPSGAAASRPPRVGVNYGFTSV